MQRQLGTRRPQKGISHNPACPGSHKVNNASNPQKPWALLGGNWDISAIIPESSGYPRGWSGFHRRTNPEQFVSIRFLA
jgi:hypothetical protein